MLSLGGAAMTKVWGAWDLALEVEEYFSAVRRKFLV